MNVKSSEGKLFVKKSKGVVEPVPEFVAKPATDKNADMGCRDESEVQETREIHNKEKYIKAVENMDKFGIWMKQIKKVSRKGCQTYKQTLSHTLKVSRNKEGIEKYLEDVKINQSKTTYQRKYWAIIYFKEYWDGEEGEDYWK